MKAGTCVYTGASRRTCLVAVAHTGPSQRMAGRCWACRRLSGAGQGGLSRHAVAHECRVAPRRLLRGAARVATRGATRGLESRAEALLELRIFHHARESRRGRATPLALASCALSDASDASGGRGQERHGYERRVARLQPRRVVGRRDALERVAGPRAVGAAHHLHRRAPAHTPQRQARAAPSGGRRRTSSGSRPRGASLVRRRREAGEPRQRQRTRDSAAGTRDERRRSRCSPARPSARTWPADRAGVRHPHPRKHRPVSVGDNFHPHTDERVQGRGCNTVSGPPLGQQQNRLSVSALRCCI